MKSEYLNNARRHVPVLLAGAKDFLASVTIKATEYSVMDVQVQEYFNAITSIVGGLLGSRNVEGKGLDEIMKMVEALALIATQDTGSTMGIKNYSRGEWTPFSITECSDRQMAIAKAIKHVLHKSYGFNPVDSYEDLVRLIFFISCLGSKLARIGAKKDIKDSEISTCFVLLVRSFSAAQSD